MNVNKINFNQNLNFMSKIIDSHAHIGLHDGITYTKNDLDVFVKASLPNQDVVEKIIVSDIDVLHGNKGELKGNTDIFNLLKEDSHYSILISCNPKDGNINEIKQVYKEQSEKFVGLKFHPKFQNLAISDPKYQPYFEFAEKNNLPCLFHTQVNLTNEGLLSSNIDKISDPEVIYATAKKYKDVPFVMAHLGAGYNEAHDKAINILIESIRNGDANLYADISWVDIDAGNKDHILKAIKRLKGIGEKDWTFGDQSYRLMFGTDAPLARFKNETTTESLMNYTKFVNEIKSAIRNDKDLCSESETIIDNLFYNNAKNLYLVKNNTQKNKNGLIIALCAIGAALLGTGYAVHKNKSDKIAE